MGSACGGGSRGCASVCRPPALRRSLCLDRRSVRHLPSASLHTHVELILLGRTAGCRPPLAVVKLCVRLCLRLGRPAAARMVLASPGAAALPASATWALRGAVEAAIERHPVPTTAATTTDIPAAPVALGHQATRPTRIRGTSSGFCLHSQGGAEKDARHRAAGCLGRHGGRAGRNPGALVGGGTDTKRPAALTVLQHRPPRCEYCGPAPASRWPGDARGHQPHLAALPAATACCQRAQSRARRERPRRPGAERQQRADPAVAGHPHRKWHRRAGIGPAGHRGRPTRACSACHPSCERSRECDGGTSVPPRTAGLRCGGRPTPRRAVCAGGCGLHP
jgi:hypothetical protein